MKQIKLKDDSRNAVLAGMNVVADLVGSTLGPKGQTVILGRQAGLHAAALVTKDGVTVARNISLPDSFENEGAKLIQEVAAKTNTMAGDGTTAATILTRAIFREGLRQVTAGADSQAVERGISLAIERVVQTLKAMAVKFEQADLAQLVAVATVAANGEVEVGEVIGKAVHLAGLEGNYTLDPSPTSQTTLEVSDGLQFERGFISPTFVTDRTRGMTVYENCRIFVTDRRLIDQKQTQTLIQMYVDALNKTPLLIIAEDVEGAALQILAGGRLPDGSALALMVCPVRAPGSGTDKKESLEDIAALTGARPYMVARGDQPEKAKLEDFGAADKVIVTPHRTTIIGGRGNPIVVETRKDELRSRIKDPETKEFVRAQLERRLAGLCASIAVIKIGSLVNSKLLEKRDRCEDSLNATIGALQEGVVPGGGTALIRCLPALSELILTMDGDRRIGAQIVARALTAPLHQLATNCGQSGDIIVGEVQAMNDPEKWMRRHLGKHEMRNGLCGPAAQWGWNAAMDEYQDLVGYGIVDPVKVVRLALENAGELAGLLLTSAGMVVDVLDTAAREQGPGLRPGGQP
jgi:chaperonin GroEL